MSAMGTVLHHMVVLLTWTSIVFAKISVQLSQDPNMLPEIVLQIATQFFPIGHLALIYEDVSNAGGVSRALQMEGRWPLISVTAVPSVWHSCAVLEKHRPASYVMIGDFNDISKVAIGLRTRHPTRWNSTAHFLLLIR
ncbi:uncharacterized protein LOC127749617 [Frankliniella occidentalis]|uniref:Uncharacterized protein LOC127749617 n=1 Tax=Frankliniella occidentalis TaxID=133901 RepID=A0A9C6TY29_FRAOC|nr:uncharacterized protein LOC127749617 [Frankliniella occidentalis]